MKKIAVYAICKNEMKFLPTWWENMSKGVDYICILDTGSTDGTLEWLTEKRKEDNRLIWKQEIVTPWAFDVARNRSMELVPMDADILVCTDFDEKWLTPNWAGVLRKAWKKGKTISAMYRFDWRMSEDGVTPIKSFVYSKIHARCTHYWKYPIHEDILPRKGFELTRETTINLYGKLILQHFPDDRKPRDYTLMIELRVERFHDSISRLYLGIAYSETQDEDLWEKAVEQFTEIVEYPDDTLRCERERSFSAYRIGLLYYLSDCKDMALQWWKRAVEIDPTYRDPLMDLVRLYMEKGLHGMAYRYVLKALDDCVNMNIWVDNLYYWTSNMIYKLASKCAYNVRKYEEALRYATTALNIDPDDKDAMELIDLISKHK